MVGQPKSEPPDALRSRYEIPAANQPLMLYEGELSISSNKCPGELSGKGTIQLVWAPEPRVRFDADICCIPDPALINRAMEWKDVAVTLGDRNVDSSGRLLGLNIGSDKHGVALTAYGVMAAVANKQRSLKSVMFHVVNFHDYLGKLIRSLQEDRRLWWCGRIVWEDDIWRVTLDAVEDATQVFKELNTASGYATTHTGLLERLDGSLFTTDQAKDLMESLHYFLSFAKGSWSPPILPVGLDEDGDTAWAEWRTCDAMQRWSIGSSWFPTHCIDEQKDLLTSWLRLWKNLKWQEVLKTAVSWYVEANSHQFAETAIVLALLGLELVAWSSLVEVDGVVSRDGFRKLQLSDRISLLLGQYSIPSGLPDTLAELRRHAKSRNWDSGPVALMEVRNAVLHPNLRERVALMPDEARLELKQLAIWYLELTLLRLLNYSGKQYCNRLNRGKWGQPDTVPWVSAAGQS